jgi:hypothetical protein
VAEPECPQVTLDLGVVEFNGISPVERVDPSPELRPQRLERVNEMPALIVLTYCRTFVRCASSGAAANLKKHGVSFDDASSAFEDKLGAYYPDTLHEDRFILIGYSRQQRLLYVVHAEVEVNAIRTISARKATKHEKARYEND